MTKLTAIQKETIRKQYTRGLTKGELARIYNVSDRTIRKVVEAK